MSVSLRADAGGAVGALQLNGADRLVLNADGTLSGTVNPTTGVRSNVLATMQKFADEFGVLAAANGWQKLPSGLIIQWATTIHTGENIGVTLPTAFPNACIYAGVNMQTDNGCAIVMNRSTTALSGSSVISATNTTGTNTYNWLALGY